MIWLTCGSGCKLTSPGIGSSVNDGRPGVGEEGVEREVISKYSDPVEVV